MTTQQILAEYAAVVNVVLGLYLDSTCGFALLHRQVNEIQEEFVRSHGLSIEHLDSVEHLYGKGDPDHPDSVVLHRSTQRDLKDRTAKEGDNYRKMASLSLVLIFQYWDDHYRGRLAIAEQVKPADIISPIFGYIRLLRNSIIHNSSFAKAQIKEAGLKSFAKGQEIILLQEDLETVYSRVIEQISIWYTNGSVLSGKMGEIDQAENQKIR